MTVTSAGTTVGSAVCPVIFVHITYFVDVHSCLMYTDVPLVA